MMKSLIVAAAVLAVSGTAAFAQGEGGGDPFPYSAPGQVYSLSQWHQAPPAIDNPYPFAVPGHAPAAETMYRPSGAQSEPESANSLPVGAEQSIPQEAAVVPSTPLTRTAAGSSNTLHN